MGSWAEHVFPHGPLTEIGPRLWYVVGGMKRGSMTRNMVVHKLASGGLLIHSAVAVKDETLAEITRLGKPEVLVVPCAFHRMDAGVWKERFPALKVCAPRAAIKAAEKVLKIDAACEEALPPLGVGVHDADGLRPYELCYEMDSGKGKALVVTDMLMNLPHLPGAGGFIMKILGSTGFFGITRIGRLMMLKDRAKYKAWLTKMASTPSLASICVAHGDMITQRVPERLREAAARL